MEGTPLLRLFLPRPGFTTPFLKENPAIRNENYLEQRKHVEGVWKKLIEVYGDG